MKVLYKPSGAAAEYVAPGGYACNIWTTCSHGCAYCYCPMVLHKRPQDYFVAGPPRTDILPKLAADCKAIAHSGAEVFLCFACDPYQPQENGETRQALTLIENHGLRANVLTKGGMRAARDFDILARSGGKFGTTLQLMNEKDRLKWEPGAASSDSRVDAIKEAHARGIHTWLSIEPVIDTSQAIAIIAGTMSCVDEYKIGKLNHGARLGGEAKRIEKGSDWPAFRSCVERLLEGRKYTIKESLVTASRVEPVAV